MSGLKRPVSGAGPRLHEELKDRGISVRSFQRTLAATGIRGSSYSSLWSYLGGNVEPPLEVVREAAELLGLAEPWLATGAGPRTLEEIGADAKGGPGAGDDFSRRLSEEIAKFFPDLGEAGLRADMLGWVWSRLSAGTFVSDPETGRDRSWRPLTDEEKLGVARRITEAISTPLRLFGVDPGHMGNDRYAELYLAAMFQALVILRMGFPPTAPPTSV